jgi:hypothetical protein
MGEPVTHQRAHVEGRTISASCRTVNSLGLPKLRGPWKPFERTKRIMPSTRSSTYLFLVTSLQWIRRPHTIETSRTMC